MGSTSIVTTHSSAVDNRLAVTDQGFGLSSSGSGNNINILDAGAVAGGLQFAQNGLSLILDSLVTRDKTAAAAAAAQTETISQAMQAVSANQAAAQVAAQAAGGSGLMQWAKENSAALTAGAAVITLVYYMYRGK